MGDACCATDSDEADEAPVELWRIREVRAAAAAGAFLVGGFMAGASGGDDVQRGMFLAALAVGGWTFVPETLRAFLRGRLGVGTLMMIAAAGAVVLGELGEAASLAFLFSISEALEGYAMARTRRGLRALLALVPERVTVRRDGGEAEIDPEQLVAGDVMVVGPGERLATDGIVRQGRSTLDLSLSSPARSRPQRGHSCE